MNKIQLTIARLKSESPSYFHKIKLVNLLFEEEKPLYAGQKKLSKDIDKAVKNYNPGVLTKDQLNEDLGLRDYKIIKEEIESLIDYVNKNIGVGEAGKFIKQKVNNIEDFIDRIKQKYL